MYKLTYVNKGETKWRTKRHNYRKKSLAEDDGERLLGEGTIYNFRVIEV